METENQLFSDIRQHILSGELSKALKMTENAVAAGQMKVDREKLASIKEEYNLLIDFWMRGYNDPERGELYHRMLRSLYTLVANAHHRERLQRSPYLKNLYQRPRQAARNWSVAMLRKKLEDFVIDSAMLELEPENERKEKERLLYQEHQQWMADVFDYIVTSMQWHESLTDTFVELLLTPTIDLRDQQLLLSAIMLASMINYDAEKIRVLMKVYYLTANHPLRQRALVGWVLCIDESMGKLYPQQERFINEMCSHERFRTELTELQMQLFYCMTVDADGQRIQQEIMPDLVKGANIEMAQMGLKKTEEEDQLDEILHPERTEEGLEKVEQRMHQMADMQKQGADIYFGGFKQMKRFPFFQTLSNWFMPFYTKHPAISPIIERTKQQRFLQIITSMGAFCDSDKYSFALIFDKVIDYMPPTVLEMIEKGEASAVPLGGAVPQEDQQSPVFIRRTYLQNLYRFFRLYPVRSEFPEIFKVPSDLLFFSNTLFGSSRLHERSAEVAAFLLKRGYQEEAMDVLSAVPDSWRDYHYYMLYARAGRNMAFADFATIDCYKEALKLKPGDRKALRGYARELFLLKQYKEAAIVYNQLLQEEPDNRQLLLGKAAAQARIGLSEEALKILYQLNYEYPDDLSVSRILAWTLSETAQYQQAEKIYTRLLRQEHPQAEDYFNYAYSLWFEGRVKEAVDVFRRYIGDNDNNYVHVWTDLASEYDRLSRHGIDNLQYELMKEAVASSL